MPFYTNPCSFQYKINDLQSQFHSKIISTVLICELTIVVIFRILSSLKNYDLNLIKKELEQKKRIQDKVIQQTMENLSDPANYNQTIMTFINRKVGHVSENYLKNSQKSKKGSKQCSKKDGDLVTLKRESLQKLNPKDLIEIKRKTDKNEAEQNSHGSQSSSQASYQQNTDQLQEADDLTSFDFFSHDYPQVFQQQQNFINVFNIKMTSAEASTFFNIILGHFFTSAALSMQHAPLIYSSIFALSHGILFIALILVKSCVDDKNNKVSNVKESGKIQEIIGASTKKVDFHDESLHNPSSHLILDKKNEDTTKDEKILPENQDHKPKLKRRMLLLIMAVMVNLNVCLLVFSIVQIKKSYLNIQTKQCQ